MQANYLYIVILVIVLVYLYTEARRKAIEPFYNLDDCCTIEISDLIIKTDTNDVINHLHMLKDNLILLKKIERVIDKTDMIKVDSIIKTCLYDLDRFKEANDFENSDLNTSDHDEQLLYGKTRESIYNMNRSDIDDYQYEKYELMNVITNIEIVIWLLLNKRCEGIINLTYLHDLIKTCSIFSCSAQYLTYDEIFNYPVQECGIQYNIHESGEYQSSYTNDHGVNHDKLLTPRLNKSNKSQDVDKGFGTKPEDGEIFTNDNETIICDRQRSMARLPKHIMAKHYNTQYMHHSDTAEITKRNGIKNYIPFCDITKLLEEHRQRKINTVDSISKRSLRNDYNL